MQRRVQEEVSVGTSSHTYTAMLCSALSRLWGCVASVRCLRARVFVACAHSCRVLRACENEGVLCLAGASMARAADADADARHHQHFIHPHRSRRRLMPTDSTITNTSSIRTDREEGESYRRSDQGWSCATLFPAALPSPPPTHDTQCRTPMLIVQPGTRTCTP